MVEAVLKWFRSSGRNDPRPITPVGECDAIQPTICHPYGDISFLAVVDAIIVENDVTWIEEDVPRHLEADAMRPEIAGGFPSVPLELVISHDFTTA